MHLVLISHKIEMLFCLCYVGISQTTITEMSRSINKSNKKLVINAYMETGYVSKHFFNNYLSEYINDKKMRVNINRLFDLNDEPLPSYVLSLKDKHNSPSYYGNLWFIDVDVLTKSGYLIIYVPSINGSSCYALEMTQYSEEEAFRPSIDLINSMLEDNNKEQVWAIIWRNIQN